MYTCVLYITNVILMYTFLYRRTFSLFSILFKCVLYKFYKKKIYKWDGIILAMAIILSIQIFRDLITHNLIFVFPIPRHPRRSYLFYIIFILSCYNNIGELGSFVYLLFYPLYLFIPPRFSPRKFSLFLMFFSLLSGGKKKRK